VRTVDDGLAHVLAAEPPTEKRQIASLVGAGAIGAGRPRGRARLAVVAAVLAAIVAATWVGLSLFGAGDTKRPGRPPAAQPPGDTRPGVTGNPGIDASRSPSMPAGASHGAGSVTNPGLP